jgi:quinoprotein dehydrogenase-associated probable ABC transporter substrate-binding protein
MTQRLRRYWMLVLAGGAIASLAALMLASAPATAQTAETVDKSALRVCADPNNMPFSNEKGEGFENKIAELLASELGVPVRYTWYPDTVGFIRNTLQARKCDLILGTVAGNELVQNSNPYYRSAYALIYREDRGLSLTSLDDPALQSLQIGAVAGTAPTTVLATNGLLGQLRSYQLVVDTRFSHPAEQVVHDVAAGTLDVGVVWGPIAGYFAQREAVPLEVVALTGADAPVKLDYRITMGMRFNEPEWKRKINALLRKRRADIEKVLRDYGVPLLDEQGQPLEP